MREYGFKLDLSLVCIFSRMKNLFSATTLELAMFFGRTRLHYVAYSV